MNYELTAEELLSQPHTLEVMSSELGDDTTSLCKWIKDFHAKTENYKKNIYYHIITGTENDYEGLYLGKDYIALTNFYGIDYIDNNEKVPIQTYYGNPNFLDMTDYNNFDVFKKHSKEIFPDEDYENGLNGLKKMILELEYDGIRYYDPLATGEEFVLYNTNKIKLIKTEKIEL